MTRNTRATVSTPEANVFTDPDDHCPCVTRHHPAVITFHDHHRWPLGMGGPDTPENIVRVCPNTHYAIHHLLREYVKLGHEPDWQVLRRFGPYARVVARDGWDRWIDAGQPEAATALSAAGWLT